MGSLGQRRLMRVHVAHRSNKKPKHSGPETARVRSQHSARATSASFQQRSEISVAEMNDGTINGPARPRTGA